MRNRIFILAIGIGLLIMAGGCGTAGWIAAFLFEQYRKRGLRYAWGIG